MDPNLIQVSGVLFTVECLGGDLALGFRMACSFSGSSARAANPLIRVMMREVSIGSGITVGWLDAVEASRLPEAWLLGASSAATMSASMVGE